MNNLKVIAEYIWLDVNNNYRSKTRIFDTGEIDEAKVLLPESYPRWSYDGSSCGDNIGLIHISECVLVPHAVYVDAINNELTDIEYVFVLCRNYYYDNLDNKLECLINRTYNNDIDLNNYENNDDNLINSFSNGKYSLIPIHKDMEPSIWTDKYFIDEYFKIGFEQEFFIIDKDTKMPLGFYKPKTSCPFTFIIIQICRHLGLSSGYLPELGPQGPYYCGISHKLNTIDYLTYVRELCIKSDINISGFNYEVAPGQAEFQVYGSAVKACNDLLMLRYILIRVGQMYNLNVNFDPVVINKKHGIFNMNGCHTNISFNSYRNLEFDVNIYDNVNTNNDDNINNTTEQLNTTNDTNNDTLIENHNDMFNIKSVQQFLNYVKKLYKIQFNSLYNYENIFGNNNKQRCTGELETSDWREFTWGLGSRDTSVRISMNSLFDNTQGNKNTSSMYLEDRRPGGNVEPFTILRYWVNTIDIIFNNNNSRKDNTIEKQIKDAVNTNNVETTESRTFMGGHTFDYLAHMIGLNKSKSE